MESEMASAEYVEWFNRTRKMIADTLEEVSETDETDSSLLGAS